MGEASGEHFWECHSTRGAIAHYDAFRKGMIVVLPMIRTNVFRLVHYVRCVRPLVFAPLCRL